jgi:hypothetical protein
MIKLFRGVRQRLLTENKLSRYLTYAIGEIALVMIGILLALQVNNWNKKNKERAMEIKRYENLHLNLVADSTDMVITLDNLHLGFESQTFFIVNTYTAKIDNHSMEDIGKNIILTTRVGRYFFPRFSVYDQITTMTFNRFYGLRK